jgi:hypothetical protein
MLEAKSSEVKRHQAALPGDPPPPGGLTLDHLELLSATLSIYYKQAVKKFNEVGGIEAKKKRITKD